MAVSKFEREGSAMFKRWQVGMDPLPKTHEVIDSNTMSKVDIPKEIH